MIALKVGRKKDLYRIFADLYSGAELWSSRYLRRGKGGLMSDEKARLWRKTLWKMGWLLPGGGAVIIGPLVITGCRLVKLSPWTFHVDVNVTAPCLPLYSPICSAGNWCPELLNLCENGAALSSLFARKSPTENRGFAESGTFWSASLFLGNV